MTIDKDTPLEEILNSSEVNDIVSNAQTNLCRKLSARSSALSSVMSGGLGENVLIVGEAVFFNGASSLKGTIDSINEEILAACNSAITLSEEKETEELTTLKTCVEKEITNLTSELNRANGEYARAKNNYHLYDDKRVAQIEASFVGENGCITIITAKKERYEEKLEEIIQRLNKLGAWKSYEDAAADGYSNVMTRNEFLRRKAAGSESVKDYETYEDYLAAMKDKYLGTTPDSNDTWKTYEDAAAAGHSEVMTRNEFLRRKAAGSEELKDYKTYEEYLAAKQKEYANSESTTSTEALATTGTNTQQTTSTKHKPVVTTVCDKVNVDGREMYYVGTTKDGINLYAEPIEGVEENGNIPEHAYIWYNRKDGSWVKSNATYGYFTNGNGANINGEVIYSNEVSRSVSYDDPKDAPFTVVEKGVVGEDYTSVYYYTSKGNDFTENAININYDTGTMNSADVQKQFKEAIENHQNIVLSPNVKVRVDPWGLWNTTTLSNGQDYTYLVYDEHTGNYYVTDSTGGYNTIDINTGYSPEDFLKDDGGVYFS